MLENGELLKAAEAAGLDVLLTPGKNPQDQMNEKDDDIRHPGTVSKPEKTRDFGLIQ